MTLALVCALSGTALAAPEASAAKLSFSDVPAGHWAHSYVMPMVEQGLFSGVTPPDERGVAEFAPDAPMTRAAFVTVVARLLFPEELSAMPAQAGDKWWQNSYTVALNHDLLIPSELNFGDLDAPMARKEMAMVLARVVRLQGKEPARLVPTTDIPDWNSIFGYYTTDVRTVYSLGLLTGVDEAGTFQPHGELSRAAAATVLYRLVNLPTAPGGAPQERYWEGGIGFDPECFWDPENPLEGMPNTAAVGEKYGNQARGYGYAIVMNFVNLDHTTIDNGLTLNGFSFTCTNPDRYEVAIALLKDVLDKESATALISWLEGLDRLNREGMNLVVFGRGDTPEEADLDARHAAYVAPLEEFVPMGNILVKLASQGNNLMICMRNRE